MCLLICCCAFLDVSFLYFLLCFTLLGIFASLFCLSISSPAFISHPALVSLFYIRVFFFIVMLSLSGKTFALAYITCFNSLIISVGKF